VLAGALELKVFEAIPEAIQAGFTSFKVFTTNILPPHPKRSGNRIDFGRIQHAMERIAPAGGIMTVHGEDEDIVQFNYEKHRAEGRMDGANLHLVHNKLSEQLAFRRTTALARHTGCAIYFVHTSAREGVEAIREARAAGAPVYGETLHQYACFNAEHYKTPRGFCSHTYPSLKFPEDQQALWHGLLHDSVSAYTGRPRLRASATASTPSRAEVWTKYTAAPVARASAMVRRNASCSDSLVWTRCRFAPSSRPSARKRS